MPEQRTEDAPATSAGGRSPVLILDPSTLTDPEERERATAELIRYQIQVLTRHITLNEGDRVQLLEPLRATWIDEDLADEEYWEEDARVHVNLPAGTFGIITLVRRYPTPYAYVVAWDRGPECGVRDHQITRCANQELTRRPANPAG